jgi:raffinose/stachyose/melibiose transport system permease protein
MKTKTKALDILRYIIFGILMLIILLPLLFIVFSSFKSNKEIFASPWSVPHSMNLDAYKTLFTDYGIGRNILNSIIYAGVTCLVVMIISSMAAYAIQRMDWKFSKQCMNFFLLGIMVPMHALLVPLYICVSKLHVPSTLTLLLIYIASAIPTAIFILVGFLAAVPRELEEAAIVDGATVGKTFRKVILPVLKPSLATIGIITFLGVWNDLMMGLIFLNKEEDKTIQLFISQFKGDHFTNYSVLLSSIVIAIIPMVIIYLFLSEWLIKGMTQGAVKG